MEEVSIYQYLNRDEAKELASRLNSNGIKAHKGIMTSGEGDLDIYQVYISRDEISKAAPIIDRYKKLLRSKQVVEKYTCPRCKAKTPHVEIVENLSFIKKLLTLGTKVVRCKKCGKEWYI